MGKASWVLAVISLCSLLEVFYATAIGQFANRVFPRKYADNPKQQTTTRWYSFNIANKTKEEYEYCESNCPWESYVSNSEFQAKVAFRDPFSIEDDQKVTALRKQLACVPFSFGYSQEIGSQLFPPYTYPPCSSLPSSPRPTLHLTNSSFSMTCPDGLSGRYILHPKKVAQTDNLSIDDLQQYWIPQNYSNDIVTNANGEFAIAGCSTEFTQAVLKPFFQAKAYQRAKETMTKKANGKKTRPISVIFITIDSFSRRHFYRKLPETLQTLNDFNANQTFAVFDFKVHNVMGLNSPINMVPMFSNQTLKEHLNPPHSDLLGPYSLWAIAKEWGFVTFLGFEYCGSNFLEYIGKKLNVDHHVSTFYCAANAVIRNTSIGSREQRCLGPHMTHYYLLNYTRAIGELYKGVNQFVYVHLNAAHEQTGQHAQTLDTDLALFLKQYTEDFGKDSDIAIMIQGDHGMAYGNWRRDIEADQEYDLPAMFLIASTELLERIPSSFDALWHNTFRLVSKRDFRATVLSLFGEPYGGTYPVHEEQYLQDAFILTREKVKDSRVCLNTYIPPWLCSCHDPTEAIPPQRIHGFSVDPLSDLLTAIVSEGLRLINQSVFTPASLPTSILCQRLTLQSITHAYGNKISTTMEQLKVEITIKELSTARIELIAIVGSDATHELFQWSDDWNPMEPYTYLGFPSHIRVLPTQIIGFSRKDKYASMCETVSRRQHINGAFCVCHDLQQLQQSHPRLFLPN